MRVWYAVDFSSCLCTLTFLLKKPSDWFAFFVMMALCVPQLGSSEKGDPKVLGSRYTFKFYAVKKVFGGNWGL